MPDPQDDILDLIAKGRKIQAIKLARKHLDMDLTQAMYFVEGLERDMQGPPTTTDELEETLGDVQDQIDALLRAKKKIDAIKVYRDATGCQLKEAKDAIELRAVDLGLQTRPSKCFIATAAYQGGEQAPVMALRRYRNRVLRPTWAGRQMIGLYETLSPLLATLVARSPTLAAVVRRAIGLLTRLARI